MYKKQLRYKVDDAVTLIKVLEPAKGYHVAFSGGKDSTVVLDLVKKAGADSGRGHREGRVDGEPKVGLVAAGVGQDVSARAELAFEEATGEGSGARCGAGRRGGGRGGGGGGGRRGYADGQRPRDRGQSQPATH